MFSHHETWWWPSLAHLLDKRVVKLNTNRGPFSPFHTGLYWLPIASQSSWISSLEGAGPQWIFSCVLLLTIVFLGSNHKAERSQRVFCPLAAVSRTDSLEQEKWTLLSIGQMWPGSSVLFQALIPRPALSLSLLRHVFDDCFLSSGNGNVFNLSYLYQAQSMNASLYVSSWRNISSYLCQAQWMNAFSRVEMVMYYKVFQICYLYEAHAFPWLMWLQRNG